ncbi:MAG: hypothetical protein D6730_21655 [Bacteroidetes bacterium]|nr:MAG: hypothetical protein D6730_21655 [Bacteroidota bacterium]
MVKFGFYALSLLMLLSPLLLIRQLPAAKKVAAYYTAGCVLWLAYLLLLANTGWLQQLDMPPRLPLLVVIPALGVAIYLATHPALGTTLRQLPLHVPVYIQSFRVLVELLIYGAFLEGVLPGRVTFEGLNYDILLGISALPVAFCIQRKIMGRKGLLLWNVLGLAVLTLTVYAFITSFYFSGWPQQHQPLQFLTLPYLLLPGVLLPFAIFYHVLSIRQARLEVASPEKVDQQA